MLCKSGGARTVAPRQGGRGHVRPFNSLVAVSLLALVGAAAFAPAQAAGPGGKVISKVSSKVTSIQTEDDFGYPAPTAFDWSGAYVGAHLGGAWGDVDWLGVDGLEISHEVDGWLAGGHLGFNQQFGRWVGGVEVSLSEGDVEGSSANEIRVGPVSGEVATKTEIDSLFLATVRLGYAFDRTLAYVKGGYASADVKLRGAGELGPAEVGFSSSERQAGFTLGGGFEYALTKGVVFGLEYNRVDLGSAMHVAFATEGNDVNAVPVTAEPDVLHVAMARLSLKFGDDAGLLPVAMK
jgi:outer membrane immunogenic protein